MFRFIFIVFTVVGVWGCKEQFKNSTNVDVALSDKSQIRTIIFENLIEKEIKPSTKSLLFISADSNEFREIAAKFPSCHVELAERAEITTNNIVQDKISKEAGLILATQWINIDGQKANVKAGYFGGASMTFVFDLQKDKVWNIEKVSQSIVADTF